MAPIILIHGSWYGAWCWDRVVSRLEAGGRAVHAPNLPGHGADQTAPADCSLAAYTQTITRVLDSLREPAVVVGHSMAGAVISTLAEERPAQIKRLVYLSAYLLADGQSIFQLAMGDTASALGPCLRPDQEAGTISVAPEGFGSALASGCTPADVELARSKARAEPISPLAQPVHVTAAGWGRVPRIYITTTDDKAVSTELQDRMLAVTPTERLSFQGGHSPFLSQPDDLAEMIAAVAK